MLFAVCSIALAFLFALILSLGMRSKTIQRITGILLLFTGISGVFLYGYGYTYLYHNIVQAAARTLFSVFCMFLGRNEISAISSVPLLSNPYMQLYIYTVHLLALYCTASAVITTLGARLILSLRLMLQRRTNLHVIYGTNADTVRFAMELHQSEKGFIVLIDTGLGNAFEADIIRMGALIVSSNDAADPAALLKKVGIRPGKRRITLYCLDERFSENLSYAEAMRQALSAASVAPEQTSLTILLADGSRGATLQASDNRYGYGSVSAFERAELLTRLMVHTYPPYETVCFDDTACATEDFEALIVGFGATGQAVLRSLIMNGQFEHSRFRAFVFSQDRIQRAGCFFTKYPAIEKNYDVRFYNMNIRSMEAADLIRTRFSHLNYVAICTGNAKENAEIEAELSAQLHSYGVHPTIVTLFADKISRISEEDGLIRTDSVFTPEILCANRLDRMAMLLNHKYHEKDGRSVSEDWSDCDYFSRMSCRAAADYVDAFLFAAKTDRKEIAAGDFSLSETVLDNLSRMEHLRWCAFHYAMGYQAMPSEVFRERAARYQTLVQENGNTRYRIGKDTEKQLHACLIPWEELPALSERECDVTGKYVDYREMDRNNVCMIIDMLTANEIVRD